MNDESTPRDNATSPAKRWWAEPQAWLLAGLVAVIYFPTIQTLPLRGEETRWAQIGREMRLTGDWVVPRVQGEPFVTRPPLLSWVTAGAAELRGKMDVVAVRAPSLVALWLTTLTLYAVGRSFLSPVGGFAAGAGFATMGQVLEIGRVAESEDAFTFFVTGALLTWLHGYLARWSAAWTWSVGYAFAAGAALTKGTQGAVCFVASTIAFLAIRRDFRFGLNLGHLAGLATFAGVIGVWQAPFFVETGWDGAWDAWIGQVSDRLAATPTQRLAHLARYPFETLICMLPWSLLPIFAAGPLARAARSPAGAPIAFLLTALAVSFAPCWWTPLARGRYFMPLYPCLALLMGWVVDASLRPDASGDLARLWRRYWRSATAIVLMTAVVVFIITAGSFFANAFPTPSLAVATRFFGLSGLVAIAAWRAAEAPTPRRGFGAILALSAFLGFGSSEILLPAMASRHTRLADEVAELRRRLPRDAKLVSFGPTHHAVVFHYETPIDLRDWPTSPESVSSPLTYFCFQRLRDDPAPRLPFGWEVVAELCCDRTRRSQPHERTIVGRRLSDAEARRPISSNR